MPFSKLGLMPALTAPLAGMGYALPTPVQAAAIPLVVEGNDLVARAQTGTGKTAAFGLPMLQRIAGRRASGARPRGLVLVPTRELAVQVHQALSAFAAPVDVRIALIVGGLSMPAQVRELKSGPQIVVATPGRLIDHLQRKSVDLSGVEVLTLDEADRMLDMGFLPPLRRILQALPKTRQTLLFSATLSPEIVRLSSEFTRAPKQVDVTSGDVVAPTISHRMHAVEQDSKRAALLQVLTQPPVGQALVFCKTKRGADRVGVHLQGAGIRAVVIHGNKSQNARTRSFEDFTTGRASVLVATDIAARGLDVARLPLVVNYDLPLVAADYVHRVGRTGRAGVAGRAISLVTPDDRHLLRDIQRLLSAPLELSAVDASTLAPAGPSTRQAATPSRSQGRGQRRWGAHRGVRHASGRRTATPA